MTSARTDRPAPLVVAASLVAVEGLLLALLGVLELGNLSSDRVMLGLTTTAFFVGYGALLLWAARALVRRQSWARSPVVLTQLIMLGLAWNYHESPVVAIGLAVLGLVVMAGIFHPDSLDALSDDPGRDRL
ncbi:hypothetical protein ACT8ZV_04915 [Nocardioides sp. MAHUQ-72]|uniref:hypothetical protein n=1 Tax=unclassified Nocardioides TaxID=2615069 RepID=UPI0036171B6C